MFPTARSAQLTIQELPGETLVFDHRTNKAHCLNQTTALVWKLCDGQTSIAAMARQVEGGAAIVELALEKLARRGLLQEKLPQASAQNRRSRRELLKKLAVAASLPAIMTVVAPRAARAASFACKTNADCAALGSNGGCQIGTCVSGKCAVQYAAANTQCAGANPSTGTPGTGTCDINGICNFFG